MDKHKKEKESVRANWADEVHKAGLYRHARTSSYITLLCLSFYFWSGCLSFFFSFCFRYFSLSVVFSFCLIPLFFMSVFFSFFLIPFFSPSFSLLLSLFLFLSSLSLFLFLSSSSSLCVSFSSVMLFLFSLTQIKQSHDVSLALICLDLPELALKVLLQKQTIKLAAYLRSQFICLSV